MEPVYADVIVDITAESLDKTFEYRVPEHLVQKVRAGSPVEIPFGKGNRSMKGYVIALKNKAVYDEAKLKEIAKLHETGMDIEDQLVHLAGWIKENYGGTMIQAIRTVLPVRQKMKNKEKQFVHLIMEQEQAKEKLEEFRKKNQKARLRLMEQLLTRNVLEKSLITGKLAVSAQVIKNFEAQGIVRVETERIYRNPVEGTKTTKEQVVFTEEQHKAVEQIWNQTKEEEKKPALLFGVTGSGKTEVYMELIRRTIHQGKQAIVLIPEIALTYQTVLRFYENFGDRISIINSRLSPGERYDQFQRAKAGDIDIMIGPRSALFTPFSRLGIIIIDEEHEGTYKSESVPRYHAREAAIERGRMNDALVVLGSATPSLEAYKRGLDGTYLLCRLNNRQMNQQMPETEIVDMRQELREGNRSILSGRLQLLIQDRLEKKEQVMLFLNRRGYAGFISCRSCGYVVKCHHCDVSLSEHNNGKMICHYCGYEEPRVKKCPECGSVHIGGFRAGTQQIEELVKKQFPNARVLRMDMDTTRKKNDHEKILSAFTNEEADILIGTQMIVKGHDFGNVTLVGVLAADLSLHTGDFRSSERTFQLLTQAVGRAGRREKKGQAVIQTYSPDHYCITLAAKQDYPEFYQQEMAFRELSDYPPAANMLAVHISSQEEELLEVGAEYLKRYADFIGERLGVRVIGPANAAISKVNDIYRKVIYLKQEQYETLIQMKNELERYVEINVGFSKMNIQMDFNPMNIN